VAKTSLESPFEGANASAQEETGVPGTFPFLDLHFGYESPQPEHERSEVDLRWSRKKREDIPGLGILLSITSMSSSRSAPPPSRTKHALKPKKSLASLQSGLVPHSIQLLPVSPGTSSSCPSISILSERDDKENMEDITCDDGDWYLKCEISSRYRKALSHHQATDEGPFSALKCAEDPPIDDAASIRTSSAFSFASSASFGSRAVSVRVETKVLNDGAPTSRSGGGKAVRSSTLHEPDSPSFKPKQKTLLHRFKKPKDGNSNSTSQESSSQATAGTVRPAIARAGGRGAVRITQEKQKEPTEA
jgi:hypothetical protein